ncbi:MAG: dihydropteroate synthase [Granulosicoccaceae bacterium]|jgi:dihydropteroate synthase
MQLDCNGKLLDLTRAHVMGILNTTPDSFSDGGRFTGLDAARHHAAVMCAEGARIIDVGGESTRPGAQAVSVQEELDRVIPLIEAIHHDSDVIISIDTSKAEVMREAVRCGAGMVNDVCALQQPGSLSAVAELGVPVCLMHMQGSPRTMQSNPQYGDVTKDVLAYLAQRIEACEQAGIKRNALVIDPGFGFGKTLEHNLQLMRDLKQFVATGLPVVVGVSRKSMLGMLLDAPLEQRLPGTVALETLAVCAGAQIIRAHDVQAAVHAARVAETICQ